jgi:hypothetical protein
VKSFKILSAALVTSTLLALLSGCEKQEGPAERAGKEADKAVEQVGKQIEKAGESVQRAAQGENK